MLPRTCWIVSIPSICLLILYPFAKRFTDFPQLILGIQVSLGFFMGIGVIKNNPLDGLVDNWPEITSIHHQALGILSFYMANVCWTVVYDTVYAQQDVEDDARAGVRSMAVYFLGRQRLLLEFVSFLMCLFLLTSGWWESFGWRYFVSACGGTMVSLSYMMLTIELSKPEECSWWFKNGCWFVGLSITTGLVAQAAS
ncbi:UbiA prenyltransferase family [Xylariomycetidae sp. FL2044]|nr:UbiA prenyltransferase family [Xylariomycetidae sp. FL2044]